MPRYERILPLVAVVLMGLGLILLVPGVDALTLAISLPNPAPEPAWTEEMVDSVGPRARASLAMDDAGHAHVAYTVSEGGLYYAFHDGMVWLTSTVDSAVGAGTAVSLAVDHAGQPHLAYVAEASGSLNYARMEKSSWTLAPLAGRATPAVSLALDDADRPLLSYYDPIAGALQYAHYDGLAWITGTVDSTADAGLYLALAVDGTGHPHLGYYDAALQDLRYAHYDGTSWQVTTVDSAGDVGRCVSLALDAAGRPYLAYYDATHSTLKVAHYNGTSWETTTVGQPGDVGPCLWLALDSDGRPHLAYCDARTGGFDYAYDDGEKWASQTVTDAGQVAQVGLALDAADRPILLYHEAATGLLKYAVAASANGLEANISIAWLILLFLLVAVAVGTEALLLEQGDEGLVAVPTSRPLRLHPALWIVPVLLTLTAFLFLRLLRGLPERAIGLGVTAVFLVAAFVSQHYLYAEHPPVRARARLASDILVYLTAYFLYGAIYTLKLRSLFSATSIVVLTFFLALALLHRTAPRGQTRLYAAVVGLAVGQITWPLNYWAIGGMIGGSLLLVFFYVLISLVRYHLQGRLTRQVALEFIIFGLLVVGGIGLYGFLIHPR